MPAINYAPIIANPQWTILLPQLGSALLPINAAVIKNIPQTIIRRSSIEPILNI